MQWDAGHQAGFTTAPKPWMRVNDNYTAINAATQTSDPDSVFHCWRRVLEQRKAHKDIFVYGDYRPIDEAHDKVLAYERVAENGPTALMACNFSTEVVEWQFDGHAKEIIVTSEKKQLKDVKGGKIKLEPCEAIALLL